MSGNKDKLLAAASAVALLATGAGSMDVLLASGVYTCEHRNADGELLSVDVFPNLVPNVGKNYLLDNGMAGSAYTAAFYMGLVDGGSAPTYNAGDTMASHAGWTENTQYSQSTRPAVSWSSASGGAKTLASGVVFSISAGGTIAGCFLTTVSTKAGTTGTLFSAGSFTGGNKVVSNGDTLTVSYSLSL